jgi:hypothetical protein
MNETMPDEWRTIAWLIKGQRKEVAEKRWTKSIKKRSKNWKGET